VKGNLCEKISEDDVSKISSLFENYHKSVFDLNAIARRKASLTTTISLNTYMFDSLYRCAGG